MKNKIINELKTINKQDLQLSLENDPYFLYNNYFCKIVDNTNFNKIVLEVVNFLQQNKIQIMPYNFGYKGLLTLISNVNNSYQVKSMFQEAYSLGLQNYSTKYHISNYLNLKTLFYLYGLNVPALLQFNLNKSSKKHRKLSERQIDELKKDLENNDYQSYSQISKKYNIRIDTLHKYIDQFNIDVKYIASKNKKSTKHLTDDYEKWVQRINNNGIKQWIFEQLIQKKIPLDVIYQMLLQNSKGYFLDKYKQKYCPVTYYINLNFKNYLLLPQEQWKEYHDDLIDKIYKSFKVSNYGRILTVTLNRNQQHIIVGGIRDKGYLAVHVRYKSENRYYSVHQLVAKCFISNYQQKKYIDHINTIPLDNRVSNLSWVTHQENSNNPITKQKKSILMKNTWSKGRFNKTNLSPCMAFNKDEHKIYCFKSVKSLQDFFNYHSHTLKERWFNKGTIQNQKHKLYGWSFKNITYEEYLKKQQLDPTLK